MWMVNFAHAGIDKNLNDLHHMWLPPDKSTITKEIISKSLIEPCHSFENPSSLMVTHGLQNSILLLNAPLT